MAKHTVAVLGKVIRAAVGGDTAGLNDRELLHRFAAGDQDAFAVLFRRHSGMVLGVCRRALPCVQDAEDACQAAFLLLSRKAASGRWQQSVANWLYLTARRVARNAFVAARRRARREGQVAVPEALQPLDRMTGRELLDALDMELDRLSPAYREPLVLCYLEGLTRDEAAARLGLLPATVKIRLERGRKHLGDALTKRGCVAGASLLVLAATSPAGAIPLRLHEAVAAAIAGNPPASVAKLASEVAVSGIGKNKLVGLLALAGAVVLGIGLGVGRPTASGQGPEKAIPAKTAATGIDEAIPPRIGADRGKEISLTGRVLGTDGKPFPGARLVLTGTGDRPIEFGTSDAEGRFAVLVPKVGQFLYLVALTEGFGCAFHSLDHNDSKEVVLRLVRDHPVRGRVVDTQGKPVAGVLVQVQHIFVYANDSVDSFLVAWKKRTPMSGVPFGVKELYLPKSSLFATKTDVKGRFTLTSLGAERLMELHLSAPGIADAERWVVNRAGFDPLPFNEASRNNIPKDVEHLHRPWLLYGPDLNVVAEAEKPIRGVLTAADTGKGRPGIEVRLMRYGDISVPFLLKATTDATGRYEIRGARKEKTYVVVVNGDVDAGYVGCEVQAADTAGYEPVTADVRMVKGVIVKGRVLDRSAGKVVPGLIPSLVTVAVLAGNPFAKSYPDFSHGGMSSWRVTAADGSYRAVTIPGPVLFMCYSEEPSAPYKQAVPDPKYPQYFSKQGSTDEVGISLYGGAYTMISGDWCKVLEIKAGIAVVEQDILLEPATAFPLQLRDAADKPLAGVLAAGTVAREWYPPLTCKTDTCTVHDLQPGNPRLLVLFEPNRKLAATLTLKGDDKPHLVVTLRPAGTIRGRLINKEGEPLAGIVVDLNYNERPAEEIHKIAHQYRQVVTDPDGSFTLEPVLPGIPYELSLKHQRKRFALVAKPAAAWTVEPGETKDLGNLAVKPAAAGPGE